MSFDILPMDAAEIGEPKPSLVQGRPYQDLLVESSNFINYSLEDQQFAKFSHQILWQEERRFPVARVHRSGVVSNELRIKFTVTKPIFWSLSGVTLRDL